MHHPMRVLVVTSEWPEPERPRSGTFIVDLVHALRDAGVQADVFSFVGARNPVRYLRAWREIQRRARSGRFDLIHAQWGHSGFLACLPKRVPLIVTFRGGDLDGVDGMPLIERWVGRAMRLVGRYAARRADATIVVSRRLARHLPRPPTAIIPSGVDLDRFHPMPTAKARAALGLPSEERLVLFVGDGGRPGKRLRLAQTAVLKAGDARLVVAHGVPPERMPLYMNACDVLLLTSLWEGSPNVVKEALACNLPVVSVDVGDVRERIGTLEGCVVCDDDQPETIAAALRAVLARHGRVEGRVAVRDLDLRLVTERTIEVYREVLEGRRVRGRHEGAESLAAGPPLSGPNPRDDPVFVSVVIPCRNEVDFIGQCLDSIAANDYPQDLLEVLVVDGASEDGTAEVVREYAGRFPFVKLLHNERKTTPAALNLGISHARGELVIRMDAHSRYAANYISRSVRSIRESGADHVGGVRKHLPRKDTAVGRAIAESHSHFLGAGNAWFRRGTAWPRWVDAVFVGCYRRQVFDTVGLFNENLPRSQDMEFSRRLVKAGGRILLDPRIVSWYYVRSTLPEFVRHNWTNGVWAVLPFAHSHVAPVSWRHLIPLAYVSAAIGLGVLAPAFPMLGWVLAGILSLYGLICLAAAIQIAARRGDLRFVALMPIVFALLHFPYGLGSAWGVFGFIRRSRRKRSGGP